MGFEHAWILISTGRGRGCVLGPIPWRIPRDSCRFRSRIWAQPEPVQVPVMDEDRVSHQHMNGLAKQPGKKGAES